MYRSLFKTKNECAKRDWDTPPPALCTSVDTDVIHMMKWTSPSPSIFAYCKGSKTGWWEGPERRLRVKIWLYMCMYYWLESGKYLCTLWAIFMYCFNSVEVFMPYWNLEVARDITLNHGERWEMDQSLGLDQASMQLR